MARHPKHTAYSASASIARQDRREADPAGDIRKQYEQSLLRTTSTVSKLLDKKHGVQEAPLKSFAEARNSSHPAMRQVAANLLHEQRAQLRDPEGIARRPGGANLDAKVDAAINGRDPTTKKLVGMFAAMTPAQRAVVQDHALSNAPAHRSGAAVPMPLTTAKHQSQAPIETGPRGGQFVRGPDGVKQYVREVWNKAREFNKPGSSK